MHIETGRLGRAAALVALVLLAAAAPRAGAMEMMDVSEVRRGMTGKGRTVFSGTTIELFDVEILGVMGGDMQLQPKRHVILARIDAPALKDGPVASGMSGSPVYIDGKLIGAVAFTWQFVRESICGITPIYEMIEDARKPAEDTEGTVTVRRDPIALPAQLRADVGAASTPVMRPIATPVMAGGCSRRVIETFAPLLRRRGLMLVQSGGTRREGRTLGNTTLRPGSAVGVRLIDGDLDYTAIGTVTHIEGDRVLAFGHPFLDEGSISAPMTAAWVHTIIPSMQSSFKMAEGTRAVGTVDRDRSTVLAGTLGSTSDMMPVSVTVRRKGLETEAFNYRVFRHRDYGPYFTGICAYASFDRLAPAGRPKMVDLAMTIHMRGREKPLTIDDRFFDDGWMAYRLLYMAFELQALHENRYEEVTVDRVSFDMNVSDGERTAFIHSMSIDGRRFRPGESVQVSVRLKPHREKDLVEKRFTVRIPENVPVGSELVIQACDAQTANQLRREAAPGVWAPETLGQLFDLVRDLEKSDRLILYVQLPRQGVSYRGRALPDLPPSFVRVMGSGNQTGLAPVKDALILREPTEYVVDGSASMNIFVVEEK